MGNTVTAAQLAASQIVGPYDAKDSVQSDGFHKTSKSYRSPPVGCPMHKEEERKSTSSECPVKHADFDNTINPLNMIAVAGGNMANLQPATPYKALRDPKILATQQ